MGSKLDIWKPATVNRSSRPILQEGEHNLYVRDNIGLYQGKLKIVNRQNGRIYLTNKRIIYLDNGDISNSIALDLNSISGGEVIERFLRSSPKVKLFLKEQTEMQQTPEKQSESGQNREMVDWVCIICSFNNQVPTDLLLGSDLPKCGSCGIRPSKDHLLKAIEQKKKQVRFFRPGEVFSGSGSSQPALIAR